MAHKNPRAALEPTRETPAQISITNACSFVFMSLAAIASSTAANSSRTPNIPAGYVFRTYIYPKEKKKKKVNELLINIPLNNLSE